MKSSKIVADEAVPPPFWNPKIVAVEAAARKRTQQQDKSNDTNWMPPFIFY